MELTNDNSKVIELKSTAKLNKITFEEVYSEFFDRIYKFLLYRVNNKNTAEDLTSVTFIKILNNLDNYNEEISLLSTWIFKIARNTLYDYYRKNSKRKFISIENFKDFFSSEKYVEDKLESTEEKYYLRKCISKLSDREQTIIALKYGAELSNSEISEIMDITISNTGVILHRTLKKIKKSMEEYYE